MRRPDIDQAVRNVARYCAREPWLTRNRDHVTRMLGSLPERYDLTPADLLAEVDALGQAPTLMGYLDEAFLSAEFGPEHANVTDEYLKRRGWQETPRAREYLQGLRSRPASLYEVRAVVPGEWLELRDRFRYGPLQRIREQSGSRRLQRWDLIVTRIVEPRGEAMLTGGALALTREAGESLDGIELSDQVFVQVWLKSLLDFSRRAPPQLQNTDGEALVLARTRLPIPSGDDAAIAHGLDALPDWVREQDDSQAWLWRSGPDTEMRTIRAAARIDGAALVVEANSRERMDRALATLRPALGRLVAAGLTTYEDPARALEHAAPRGATPAAARDPALAGPELDAALQEFKDAHYRRILDEPVPKLGNKTPRACARSKQGRIRLVSWLKDLENGELRQAAATGTAPYDIGWIWRELGVTPN